MNRIQSNYFWSLKRFWFTEKHAKCINAHNVLPSNGSDDEGPDGRVLSQSGGVQGPGEHGGMVVDVVHVDDQVAGRCPKIV